MPFYQLLYHLKSETSIMPCSQLCSTYYTAVWIKNYSKSTSVINVATIKNMDNFCYAKGSHHILPLNWHFLQSAKTKEDTDKSMKNALYRLLYCSMPSWAEVTLNSEKIKPIAFAAIELHLSEESCNSQSLVQSVSWSIETSIKFKKQFLKAFQVNLKACLGLVFRSQYCLIITWENLGWFLGDIILWAMPTE